eukprot:scaffold3867_cov254-Pinguiococcus_pyrenoidosus.AAC.2
MTRQLKLEFRAPFSRFRTLRHCASLGRVPRSSPDSSSPSMTKPNSKSAPLQPSFAPSIARSSGFASSRGSRTGAAVTSSRLSTSLLRRTSTFSRRSKRALAGASPRRSSPPRARDAAQRGSHLAQRARCSHCSKATQTRSRGRAAFECQKGAQSDRRTRNSLETRAPSAEPPLATLRQLSLSRTRSASDARTGKPKW